MNEPLPIKMQVRTNPKGYEAHAAEHGLVVTGWTLDVLREHAALAANKLYKGRYCRPFTVDDISFSFTIGGGDGNG